MWEDNAEVFERFTTVHDQYQSDRRNPSYKHSFDETGAAVRAVIEEWDQRLCQQMERGQNGVFSSKVSEKFWNEVKKDFPLIDFVGVQVQFSSKASD